MLTIKRVLLAIVAGLVLAGGLGVKSASASQRCEQNVRHCAQVRHDGHGDYGYNRRNYRHDYGYRGGYGHDGYRLRLRYRLRLQRGYGHRYGDYRHGGYRYYDDYRRWHGPVYYEGSLWRWLRSRSSEPQPQQVVYLQPRPQPRVTYAQPQAVSVLTGCRQVREYQTTITVGGKKVSAYGSMCYMSDGSWQKFGLVYKAR